MEIEMEMGWKGVDGMRRCCGREARRVCFNSCEMQKILGC